MGHIHLRTEELDAAYMLLEANAPAECPVVRIAQAQAWGVPRSHVVALVRRGLLVKVRHGVYCLAPDWESSQEDAGLRRRLIAGAALSGLKPPVLAHGPFAAELHGLPLADGQPSTIELVRHRGRDVRSARDRLKTENRLDGVVVLSRDLSNETSHTVMGIPSIGVDAAAVTAAARFRRESAVAVLDAALRQGCTDGSLLDACARWSTSRGISAVGQLVSLSRVGAESVLESVSRVRLVDRGVPEPILQHEFHDDRGFVARVDMWWEQWNVVGEADGLAKYLSAADLRAEKIREQRLRGLGVTVVRWTWEEIWQRPRVVVERILSAANTERIVHRGRSAHLSRLPGGRARPSR